MVKVNVKYVKEEKDAIDMGPEQKIQSKIVKFLKEKKAYIVKVISATQKGVPDIIGCYKGKFIGIEVKQPKTKNNVSELQKHNLLKITEAGGYAMVAWSIEQVEQLTKEIDDLPRT